MNIYKAYDSGEIIDLGVVSEFDLPSLLKEAVASIGKNDFCVGANRNNKDFVEIRPVGNSKFMIWSDRLCKTGSFWQRLKQKNHIQEIVDGEAAALEALRIYMSKSREIFESSYTRL